MILANAAPRYTRVSPGSTATAIAGGETIRVHGILVAPNSGASGSALVLDNLGATIMQIFVSNGVPFEMKTGFIADKGVKITTDAVITCVVFHSTGGI